MSEARGPVGRVSVCMASYNGARYLPEQLRSILDELGADDELVIVDDASGDETVAIIESVGDARIQLYRHEVNQGYVRTFESALGHARGDLVLLADQDDVWIRGRVDRFRSALERAEFAASELVLLGSDKPLRSPVSGRPWHLGESSSGRNIARILAGDMPYFGCAMGFRRSALDLVLPFPDFLTESHDLWIALVANSAGKMQHIAEPTLRRRVHGENASTERPRGLVAAIASRRLLVRALSVARRRVRRRG